MSKIWKQAIAFRDCLKKNKRLREEYEEIKKEAVRLGKEGKDFRRHKIGFSRK